MAPIAPAPFGVIQTANGCERDSNPCLVMVAFSPRFPITSERHDSKEIDVTQTRTKTVPFKTGAKTRVAGSNRGPQCSDGNRLGPVRISCPCTVLGIGQPPTLHLHGGDHPSSG